VNQVSYEIPTEMRDFAEKSVEQARKAFEGFIGAAQKAVGQADSHTTTVTSNARAIGDKAVTFAEQNVRSAFDFAQKVVRVSDMQELLALQSEFVRSQMAALQDQAKEFGSAVQSATQSTVGTLNK
jgi:phasin